MGRLSALYALSVLQQLLPLLNLLVLVPVLVQSSCMRVRALCVCVCVLRVCSVIMRVQCGHNSVWESGVTHFGSDVRVKNLLYSSEMQHVVVYTTYTSHMH